MSIVLQNIDFMPPAVCKVFLTMFAQAKGPLREGAFDVKLLFRYFIRLHARFFFEGTRKQHDSINNSRQCQKFFV